MINNTMISYTSSFISEYYLSLENKTLDVQLLECLNSILETINNDISLNNIDNDNDFRFKKTKLKGKSNDNYYQQSYNNNNNNTSRSNSIKKKEETRTKIELVKSSIKSILNKLAPSNYSKLEQELITMYIELLTNCIESNNNEDINYIDNYIITYICYNNVSYSTIYSDILFSIFNVYYNKNYKLETITLYNLLQKYYNEFLVFDTIIKYNNSIICDDFVINKNNDKYKCFIIFIINLYKHINISLCDPLNRESGKQEFYSNFFINHDCMKSTLSHFTEFFIKNLELENNKIYCETIQEFLLLFCSELFKISKVIKLADHTTNILCDLHGSLKLLLLNNANYPSFTTKIKFKLMNICDKYDELVKT
jgi:hypothetical protein|uniref:Uncharacterized protein n=1 Tax=viral metagenome TaxID=1070528 RepID=A0A6C0CCY3_9ZZZZ